jgi:hypothetical protein
MSKSIVVATLIATLFGASIAQAQAPAPAAAAVQPSAPPPATAPPPPPATGAPAQPPIAAPPPAATVQYGAPPPMAAPAGQWVYTSQYGWLWMPYQQSYTYVAPDASLAYSYVFYPAFGWRWVVAPWILGFGPVPFWGTLGPTHFVWYSRPWFRPAVPFRGHVVVPYRGPVGVRHIGGGRVIVRHR